MNPNPTFQSTLQPNPQLSTILPSQRKGLIIVTGSSGRIGTLVTSRLAPFYRVVGIDFTPPKQNFTGLEYLSADLGSDDSVQRAFDHIKECYGEEITSVIHLAAYYSFSGRHPELYDKVTVQGTHRILDALRHFRVEQFLFSSTQLIYAPCPVGETINELSPIAPEWAYPASKVRTERVIHEQHGKIPFVIMQIAGCYDNECHSIPIANQIQRIYEKQLGSRVYPGDITHGAPFLHLDDLVDAIELAVERRQELPPELTMLIGEDRTMSYDEVQRELSRLILGKEIRTLRIPKWFAKIGAWTEDHMPCSEESFIQPWMVDRANDHYQLDISLAKKTLGWNPKHFVGDTMPKMVEFLKSDPVGFYRANGLRLPHWMDNKKAGCRGCCHG